MNATTLPTGTVLVDGLRIRYADSGADGPIILLTSPWPESLFAFRRVWPALAPTARLVAIDLPGFGHSEGRSDVFTPTAMGEFLLRFIAERGLGTPHLVAPDVGASAALFLAARHPDAVRSLVVGGGAAAFPLEVTGHARGHHRGTGHRGIRGPGHPRYHRRDRRAGGFPQPGAGCLGRLRVGLRERPVRAVDTVRTQLP